MKQATFASTGFELVAGGPPLFLIALAVRIGAGVAQGAAAHPGAVDANGDQALGEERQLYMGCGAGSVVPLHVDSTAGELPEIG